MALPWPIAGGEITIDQSKQFATNTGIGRFNFHQSKD